MNEAGGRREPWALLRVLAASLFPGALAGTQLAGLLFFLNPHIPFEPATVVRGLLFYAALLGTAGLPLFLLLCRGEDERARRALPGWLTAILLLGAAFYWVHALYFGFFLPPGINRRLIKAAAYLSVAAIVCFYTIVLHRLRHRPYGIRSRVLFVVMALISIYVVVERREAFRPSSDPAPRPTTVSSAGRPQLAVVAVDAATLDAVLPLAEQGRLPFLAASLESGAYGRLEPLEPVREDPLWVTLSTGLLPYRHGFVGNRVYETVFLGDRSAGSSFRLLPVGMSFEAWGTWGRGRPADRRDAHASSLWTVLSRLGLETAVVGWPATSPPSADVPFVLSDRFFEGGAETGEVRPTQLAQRARLFETRTGDLDPDLVARFGEDPAPGVLRQLCRDLWRRDLAFFLLDREPLDAIFLRLPGLGEVSRRHYGGFEAVRFEGSTEEESVESARLLTAYYGELDSFLARLWESMRGSRLLVIVSTHGAEGADGLDELLRLVLRRPARAGQVDEDVPGIFLLRGDDVRAGTMLQETRLVDPMPTLLYGLGLPVARDLDGSVVTDAFDPAFLARQPLSFVPSYETFGPREDRRKE